MHDISYRSKGATLLKMLFYISRTFVNQFKHVGQPVQQSVKHPLFFTLNRLGKWSNFSLSGTRGIIKIWLQELNYYICFITCICSIVLNESTDSIFIFFYFYSLWLRFLFNCYELWLRFFFDCHELRSNLLFNCYKSQFFLDCYELWFRFLFYCCKVLFTFFGQWFISSEMVVCVKQKQDPMQLF